VREISAVFEPARTSFDPSGARIVIGSDSEPTAMVVDIATGEPVLALEGHRGGITDVAWSPDGSSIASASYDGTTRIFDASTGGLRFAFQAGGGHVYDLDWSPDATRLVTGDSDGAARVWRLTEGGPREEFTLSSQDTRNGVAGVAFSPGGTRVLTGDFGTTAAQIWDVSIGGAAEVANLPGVAGTPGAVAFTADGRNLVATGPAGTAVVWDARTYTPVRTLGAARGPGPAPAEPSGADVYSIAVSRDGRLVAGAQLDGPVHVWDASTGRDAMSVDDPGPTFPGFPFSDLAWNPAGDVLAIAVSDGSTGRVSFVDRSGRRVGALPVESGTAVASLQFSHDGDQLITPQLFTTGSRAGEGQVVVWDWRTATRERVFVTAGGDAALSPTADLLAVVGYEQGTVPGGSVEVWNPATGRRVTALEGSTGVVAVAFSADGSRLATAGHDGTVRIWDPATGEQLQVLRGHDASVDSVAFSHDGTRLASIGEDGVVRVWTLDLDELLRIAEHQVTRRLTDEECRQYLHVRRCD
jgi:WD40 repeat protein